MLKILKILGLIALFLIASLVVIGISLNEPLPEGKSGDEAELLADEMLAALNKTAYDSLNVISWTFPAGHEFVWKKEKDSVNVQWGEFETDLHTSDRSGFAYKNGRELTGEEKENALDKAWKFFVNDSFWLVAPFKVRDPGTTRQLVETGEGPALLVTYTSGGVTPGDSYLWILDENSRPKEWKMWVSIIPIGGLAFTWEDWVQKGGAWFAPTHQGPGPASVNLTNLSATP